MKTWLIRFLKIGVVALLVYGLCSLIPLGNHFWVRYFLGQLVLLVCAVLGIVSIVRVGQRKPLFDVSMWLGYALVLGASFGHIWVGTYEVGMLSVGLLPLWISVILILSRYANERVRVLLLAFGNFWMVLIPYGVDIFILARRAME